MPRPALIVSVLALAIALLGCNPGAPAFTPDESRPGNPTPQPTAVPTVASSPSPTVREIDGYVGLTAAAAVQTGAASCEGLPAYDDIREGTQVFVKDGTGTIIGTGRLEAPAWLATLSVCIFHFVVISVPDSALYVVEPSTRAGRGLTFSRADIEAQGWHVEMTFGD